MGDVISGRHTVFKIYFNNNPWSIIVKSWKIEEISVEVEDHVCGEDRARFQIITSGYRASFECYDDENSSILENLLTSTANDDAFNPQLPLSGGALFKYVNGSTRKAFVLNACTRGPLNLQAPGRTERLNHSLSIRARYFAQVPSA